MSTKGTRHPFDPISAISALNCTEGERRIFEELDKLQLPDGVKKFFWNETNMYFGGVHAVFADEEMPPELYDEIDARLSATDGYLNKVFTATEGHEIWFNAMERQGDDEETFKDARKWIVSLYDCQTYEDGTEGAWPLAKIKDRERRCSTEAERLKRVMGRFIKDEGLKYSSFLVEKNLVPAYPIPKDYDIYSSVDVGSGRVGGMTANERSSAAIVFIGVSPDQSKATVFKMWRGDGEETSAGDIFEKWVQMSQGLRLVGNCYDYNSREFGLMASRNGASFQKADKSRDIGEQSLNTLFKNCMLDIQETDHSGKMVGELLSVPTGAKKRKVADDLTDALRYGIMQVPWDWTQIPTTDPEREKIRKVSDRPLTPDERKADQIRQRRGEMLPREDIGWAELENEIDYWNEQYGA